MSQPFSFVKTRKPSQRPLCSSHMLSSPELACFPFLFLIALHKQSPTGLYEKGRSRCSLAPWHLATLSTRVALLLRQEVLFSDRGANLLLLTDRCWLLQVELAFGNLINGPSQPTWCRGEKVRSNGKTLGEFSCNWQLGIRDSPQIHSDNFGS